MKKSFITLTPKGNVTKLLSLFLMLLKSKLECLFQSKFIEQDKVYITRV